MGGRTMWISGFPAEIDAPTVQDFLEAYTGEGSICAVRVRVPKPVRSKGSKPAYALVQFTDNNIAEGMKQYIHGKKLYYLRKVLTVRVAKGDILPNPKVPMFGLPEATLHFGCLVAKNHLLSLCCIRNAQITFGANMRKITFSVSWEGQSYKLEFGYDSIWEIQLFKCASQFRKFILFTVTAAPKIYKKQTGRASVRGIFFNDSDDLWKRTVDFTSSCAVGQSFVFCLEIASDCSLPEIKDYFFYYKEINSPFEWTHGHSYSRSLDLVPIVHPPSRDVPYRILFKINVMVQNGTLSGPTLDDDFYQLVNPGNVPYLFIERALEDLSYSKTCCLQPSKWLQEKYAKYKRSKHPPKSALVTLNSGLVYIHRVEITPSKVYFYGPEVIVSNRVLRKYREYVDNFIRISFVDEDGEKMRSMDLVSRALSGRETEIYRRIVTVLQNGIAVGDKRFNFLAFSGSQLRENSAWMFASTDDISSSSIRRWMGDFHDIRNVAKYAARLGQSFGSSTETLRVQKHEVETIPDIEVPGKYIFSDGIGKISPNFARQVAAKCNIKNSIPSAFQIRYAGYKGVVAVDPSSRAKLSLRRSMSKYRSDNKSLDVLGYSKYQPCHLNRQLITLLSTLGVKDAIFERKQSDVVRQLEMILTDPTVAMEALDLMSPGEITNVLKEMLSCGYRPEEEPFLMMMLRAFRAAKLMELRKKARIFIPEGRSMMGCLDETRTLEYGQVFIQVSHMGSRQLHGHRLPSLSGSTSTCHPTVIVRKVVVAKNPCLHPGDMRVLTAVDVPRLHHMVDCVVFPQKGPRPHPNECSGSDLDGDIYFVSWDSDLIPPRQIPPMDYTPAPTEILDHDVTIEEVEEYFAKYMVNDSLGIIANAHTAFADRELLKAESEKCIELARLFSVAVDFPKTGVPAKIPHHLYASEFPDFMEKRDGATYESKGVIGKLFRAVKTLSDTSSGGKGKTKKNAVETWYDRDMEVGGFEYYIDEALFLKEQYDFKLGNLMDHYGVKTESEILGGTVLNPSKTLKSDVDVLGHAVRSLRKEAKAWFAETSGASEGDEDDDYAKASAWYHVTYHPNYWDSCSGHHGRPHLLSFPWCVSHILFQIKRRNKQRTAEELPRWVARSLAIY